MTFSTGFPDAGGEAPGHFATTQRNQATGRWRCL